MQTALREFMEESLGTILTIKQAKYQLINRSTIIKRYISFGIAYNFLIKINVDFEESKKDFEEYFESNYDVLPKEMRENCTLVAVSLEELFDKVRKTTDIHHIYVTDISGTLRHLRSICYGTLNWLKTHQYTLSLLDIQI